MIKPVKVGSRLVGPGQPCFIIAEAGVNHNGEMEMAFELIDKAAAAGADAVKFQAFITEEIVTADAPKARYQVETTGTGGGQFAMLKALELSREQQVALKERCETAGIQYLCTPYDSKSVDMLAEIGVNAYKIASTDTTNIPLLRQIAGKGVPVLLSTGMSDMAEVEAAVRALADNGLGEDVIILHCTSEYPAPFEEVNLRAMDTMERAFKLPVGFSDHTVGIGASPWSVALGACVVEKHYTLSRDLVGPDHRASIEPDELEELVNTIRQLESSLGDGRKLPMPSEIPNKPRMQKSLVARRAFAKGEKIEASSLTCKRPGTGLAPRLIDEVSGKTAARDIAEGAMLTMADIDWSA